MKKLVGVGLLPLLLSCSCACRVLCQMGLALANDMDSMLWAAKFDATTTDAVEDGRDDGGTEVKTADDQTRLTALPVQLQDQEAITPPPV